MEFLLIILGVIIFLGLMQVYIRKHANFSRCLDMAFLRIEIPIRESKEDRETERESFTSGKDFKEVTGLMTHFFEALYNIYDRDFKYKFIGQDYVSLEYAVLNNEVYLYVVAPRELTPIIEKQITSFYPHCYTEITKDYNIFRPKYKTAAATFRLVKPSIYPIKTYARMPSDPINNLVNAVSKLDENDGAAIQFIIRPKKDGWQEAGRDLAEQIMTKKKKSFLSKLNPLSFLGTIFSYLVNGPNKENMQDIGDKEKSRTTPLTDEQIKAIEEKNTKIGFETVIRAVTSAKTEREAKLHMSNIKNAFGQYCTTDNNSLSHIKYFSKTQLIRNFIYRNLRRTWVERFYSFKKMVLSSEELASLFHIPNINYNKSPNIHWENFKISPPPKNLPKEGLLLGYNFYRGSKTPVFLKREDRFRHFYVIGQTGTGKSSVLQVMIRQDLKNGDGLCVVDPHGSLVEDILPFIPRDRADDVIYFNPGDLERPIGLNLLEAETESEKDLVALDAMNIMIKLFDEEVFGPRIQDYFRNGCLTLMADPEGAALTDIVRLFTDDEFQRYKVTKVTNPIVKSFWVNQMAKTGAREKQEMIPYFAAKFGQFTTNTMMRNIIGQTKSAFDFAKVMQEGKILLMNLSKGETGEINSKLLGMIIVSKIQQAAMRRQKISKEERKDFFLYVDEFQNYVTDTIESILSEARKYRLGLIMAHQYIKQLEGADGKSKVKDAVFGNVGSMMSYKISAMDAEYIAKEMAPVFSEQDLVNIDKYKAVMKLSIDTQPSKPFSIIPVNPYLEEGDKEVAEAIKQLSRLKYGRDKEFVDREIIRRMGAEVPSDAVYNPSQPPAPPPLF